MCAWHQKQLNVEIQEIQVNIKRKNYVNQKVKARGVVATLAATGSQLNIKAVAKKIFSAKASVRVESERERERGKNITRFLLSLLSGPSQKWTMQSLSSSDAAAEQRSVWAAKLPNNQHTHTQQVTSLHSSSSSSLSSALREPAAARARAKGEFELYFSSFLARVRCGSLSHSLYLTLN